MNERQTKILEILQDKKTIEVTALSSLLNVSQVTVRKDLIQLEGEGLLVREHGYATIKFGDDIQRRMVNRHEEKLRIARKAVELIHDGETIMIESGSCCALLAKEVSETKKNITIITNSAFIADYVRKQNVKIILLGGEYQNESQVMVGPLVKNSVSLFNVDKFFIGVDGYHDGKFTGSDFNRCVAVQDMAKQAREVYVITDGSKFNATGLVNLLELKDVKGVITDEIDDDKKDVLKENGVEVYIA